MSNFLWAKKQIETKNSNLVFVLDVEVEKDCLLIFNLTANGMYKLYVDNKLRMYGPARTAKNYCRIDKKSVSVKNGSHRIVAIASAYNVATFNIIKDTPYFYCKLYADGKTYLTSDFKCYDFAVRVKNVQRYSFQRGFAESFEQDFDLVQYFSNPSLLGEELDVVEVAQPKILKRGISYPHLFKVKAKRPIQIGDVMVDNMRSCWEDRSLNKVGKLFEGYYRNELKECLTDTVSKFVYKKTNNCNCFNSNKYLLFDFKRNISGFLGCDLAAFADSEIYIIFDEILNENGLVDFNRLLCCNVVKWSIKKGDYSLQTIEPYTMRYAQIIVRKGHVKIDNVNIVPVENKDAYNLKFKIADKRIEKILQAAANTVAQNSSDLLMDCPSRERAGWINDIYYSRHSATMFTGRFDALRNTLENYVLAEQIAELPKNMIPMCYPADHIDGVYIPNCAFWYVIVVCEYILNSGDEMLKKLAKKQIFGIMDFFHKYENRDGLLENLDGWVFVEWSSANSKDFVCGVNYPSNMMYYKMLNAINKIWNTQKLTRKCERIKKNILKQSYNGEFFEDNRVRVNNKLKSLNHISEACQYHAFFSGIATKETHQNLYNALLNVFTPERNKITTYPNIDKANIITGVVMRETMLIENGEVEKALKEIVNVYEMMADKTMTLWEHVNSRASCNHGIGAYAGCIIIAALTGFMGFYQDVPQFIDKYVGIDCEFFFPWKNGGAKVVVKKGKREVNII